jgi:RimJ/RimL family protein N-acetyltransferase
MIYGNKVILREITLEDTDLIISWRNNPRVQQQFIFREKFTREIHTNWIENHVKTGDAIQYIIIEKETNKPIGSVYYSHVDRNNECAEFGIFIGEDEACGYGLGHEAIELFIKYGFKEQHFHRIYLRVIRTNENAHQLYRKVGFKEDAIVRDMVKVDGTFLDIVMMSIYADECI